jgi:AcrR family transcriptional regulator
MFDVTSDSAADVTVTADPRVARSRQKLLGAATELLVEAGPRAVTVDAVAERSGVAKSTLYRNWDSRKALLIDVMRTNVPEIAPPSPEIDFDSALRSLVRDLATTLAQPEWSRIMPALISLRHQVPELQQLSDSDRDAKTEVLAEVLRRGVDEGRVPAGLDPHRVGQVLVGPLVFAILEGLDDAVEIADYAVDRFIASYA